MQHLRQNTAVTVSAGPFVSTSDGTTPNIGLLDQSSACALQKNGIDSGAITLASWAHSSHGHYAVGLGVSHTDSIGLLRLQFSDPDTYLPVWEDFSVLSAAVYDSLYGTEPLAVIYGEGGSIEFTYTVYDTNGTTPLPGCAVYVSSDLAGEIRSQAKVTDALGRVVFDLDPGTVYFWRSHPGRTFSDPDSEEVGA